MSFTQPIASHLTVGLGGWDVSFTRDTRLAWQVPLAFVCCISFLLLLLQIAYKEKGLIQFIVPEAQEGWHYLWLGP